MAPVQNSVVLFNEIPTGMSLNSWNCSTWWTEITSTGYPVPSQTMVHDTSQTIDLESVSLHGGILVKTLVVSVDPYLRGKMRDASIESYSGVTCDLVNLFGGMFTADIHKE
ncbi:hypothetical protein BDZ89DRAFT_1039558 [Hymenopellis radicata]|nr:hypothetical protein BDZ89DRAFT_1039558 [Hymenopellis radicata]